MSTALVVDDNHITRRVLRRIFEDAGMRVVEALTARDALDIERSEVPELVIVDLALGTQPDGETVMKEVRARRGADVVIVCCSGSVEWHDRDRYQLAGWTDVWAKPVRAVMPAHIAPYVPRPQATGPLCTCLKTGYVTGDNGTVTPCASCTLARLSAVEARLSSLEKGS